jgi:predicted negative regulator of RcsB-dependent stress response
MAEGTRGDAMENFSKRTTAIIAVCFVLAMLGWNFGWQIVAEVSFPAVHCDYHFQKMTCSQADGAG